MFGIVGFAGTPGIGPEALQVVHEGLRRLEYRGYDSAGAALQCEAGLVTVKRSGKLGRLEAALEAHRPPASVTGIGHTRWATHGGPTDENAHPHLGGAGRVAVIHNGIIENFARLRAGLVAAGVEFASQTDTEVAAHLLAAAYDRTGDLTAAMREVAGRLQGTFTLLAIAADAPGVVVGARRNSPLAVGLGTGANYLGSDVAAFIGQTREAVELGQDQVVTITADSVSIVDVDGNPVQGRRFSVEWDAEAAPVEAELAHEFGALKLKELAHIQAEGFAAGELKHGPIALIEAGRPVFVIMPSPRSRDPLHAKGLDVDQPRNLAKSVTVEQP